jgi:hypothetical protein
MRRLHRLYDGKSHQLVIKSLKGGQLVERTRKTPHLLKTLFVIEIRNGGGVCTKP